MTTYQKELIAEHNDLCHKIQKLHTCVYDSIIFEKDNKVEYANKCIQLSAMKKYEEALRCRMENVGIVCDDGEYYTKVTQDDFKTDVIAVCVCGSDYDADTNKIKESKKKNE